MKIKLKHVVLFTTGAVTGIVIALFGIVLWIQRGKVASGIATGTFTDLGQIGDFMGGVLNPLISVFALIWLALSLISQKEELEATKQTLQESARSQDTQAIQSKLQTRIAALTALITSATSEVNVLQSNIHFMIEQDHFKNNNGAYDHQGNWHNVNLARDVIATLAKEVDIELKRQENYETELRVLLFDLDIERSPDQPPPNSR